MRSTLVAAAVAVILAVGAAPATWADEKSDSTVTVTKARGGLGGTTIKGKVKSGNSDCKKGRKVKVYHDVEPLGPSDGDFLLGTVTTNNRGKWTLDTSYAPDRVYAKLKANKDCTKDTSETVEVVGAL